MANKNKIGNMSTWVAFGLGMIVVNIFTGIKEIRNGDLNAAGWSIGFATVLVVLVFRDLMKE